MKIQLIILSLVVLSGCATKTIVIRPYAYGGSRPELMRAGSPQTFQPRPDHAQPCFQGENLTMDASGLQVCHTEPISGESGSGNTFYAPTDQANHTCSSMPHYNLDGVYQYHMTVCQ